MNQTVCNICEKPVAQRSWRLWPNSLGENHPLRFIALDVVLVPADKRHFEQEWDLCDEHIHELLRGIYETSLEYMRMKQEVQT
jgi:hypothetical protein